MNRRLKEIKDRVDTATEGPWAGPELEWVDDLDGGHPAYAVMIAGTRDVIARDAIEEDAELILHARSDLTVLLDAVTEVLALHSRRAWRAGDPVYFGQAGFEDLCDHCKTTYPCDTMQLIDDAITGRE